MEEKEIFCEACHQGQLDIVETMLKINPGLVKTTGSVARDHREYMQKFGGDVGWTPLHLACHYGHLDVAKALIEAGANVNAISVNNLGTTPLHSAAAGGKEDIALLLIARGASKTTLDRAGHSPLDIAIENRLSRLVEALKK